jgi:hypothetical protein
MAAPDGTGSSGFVVASDHSCLVAQWRLIVLPDGIGRIGRPYAVSFSIEKTAWNQPLSRGAAIWAAITNIENASETTMTTLTPCSLPQDLVHGLTLGQFIHQLV